jgi:uncharacterized protein YqjF (DUF2071 family)
LGILKAMSDYREPSVFNYQVVDEIAHRPWPMPQSPWIMTQTWLDLAFAHWRVDPAQLAARIPKPLELDLYGGDAWIAVVPFRMANVGPRAVPPLPWVSAFPEVNVRTYVRLGDRPGVFFFSLDATNPVAVRFARTFFHLPYFNASIELQPGDVGVARYTSRRTEAPAGDLIASYRPTGPVFHAEDGTLEYFLTERYCLYALDRRGGAHICEIHHPRWPLQLATGTFEVNTLLQGLVDVDPLAPALLHFSKRQDTINWRPSRV